jgi:3-deoxy-D-manno-octulosonic-acid transferase
MRLIYDIGIRLYWFAAWIVSRWDPKAKKWIRGRKGWLRDLGEKITTGEKVIWFHCSSLGEFEQGRPLMEDARVRFPAHKLLLTFFSPSGYEKRKGYEEADHVMYLPLDTSRNARLLTDALSLEMVIFIKYEFWYHILHRLNKKGIPLFLASSIFRPGQLFFSWYGGWYRRILGFFTHIFVQQEASLQLLRKFGITRVTVAGDTRFDRVRKAAETPYPHPVLEQFTGGRFTVVAGSTWEKDEQILAAVYRKLPEQMRWIIAPHELSDPHLQKLSERFPGSCRLSGLTEDTPAGTRVVIVDSIGQLSFLYRYGNLAYIGGGFGKGIHNILEAAVYFIPVIFGPNHQKFLEAGELIGQGGAFPVLDDKELLLTIHQQMNDEKLLKRSSQIAGTYVLERVGATSAIMDAVCKKSGLNML